jgi:hypothetical protein
MRHMNLLNSRYIQEPFASEYVNQLDIINNRLGINN